MIKSDSETLLQVTHDAPDGCCPDIVGLADWIYSIFDPLMDDIDVLPSKFLGQFVTEQKWRELTAEDWLSHLNSGKMFLTYSLIL